MADREAAAQRAEALLQVAAKEGRSGADLTVMVARDVLALTDRVAELEGKLCVYAARAISEKGIRALEAMAGGLSVDAAGDAEARVESAERERDAARRALEDELCRRDSERSR